MSSIQKPTYLLSLDEIGTIGFSNLYSFDFNANSNDLGINWVRCLICEHMIYPLHQLKPNT